MARTPQQQTLPLRLVGEGGRTEDWRIDDQTREVGRRGLAAARAALAAAARRSEERATSAGRAA
jgi:hypothetical protein